MIKYKPLLLSPLGLIPMGLDHASAADMPVKAKAPQVVTFTPNWAGFYVGGNAGVISDRSRVSTLAATAFNYCFAGNCDFTSSQTAVGVIGGLQVGYNVQSGRFVYGFETDINLSSAKKDTTTTYLNGAPYDFIARTGIETFGTARLRLGYTFDRALVYATGGLAYAKVRNSFSATASGNPYSFSETKWSTGYTVGGGLEYAFTDRLTVKGEGLYYNLGSKDRSSTYDFNPAFTTGFKDKTDGFILRMGINYLFH